MKSEPQRKANWLEMGTKKPPEINPNGFKCLASK